MTCIGKARKAHQSMDQNGCTPISSSQPALEPDPNLKGEKGLSYDPDPAAGAVEAQPPVERMPYRYWQTFDHLQARLTPYIQRLGRLPTKAELDAAGDKSLAIAILGFGGYPAVARRLGVNSTAEHKRSLRSSQADQQNGLAGKSSNKRKYLPRGYWGDFEHVVEELKTFAAERGLNGRMPTVNELRRAGKWGLAKAIQKHGGFEFLAFWLHWKIESRCNRG